MHHASLNDSQARAHPESSGASGADLSRYQGHHIPRIDCLSICIQEFTDESLGRRLLLFCLLLKLGSEWLPTINYQPSEAVTLLNILLHETLNLLTV